MTSDLSTNVGTIRSVLQHNLRASASGDWQTPNPHDFHPDMDNPPEQRDAHSAACEAFDKGEPVSDAPWGPGIYFFERPEVAHALEALEVLGSELEQMRKLAGPKIMVQLLRDANRYAAIRAKHIADYPHVTTAEYDTFADTLTNQG